MSTITAIGVRLSALPAADEPLEGTELVPLVQDGVTRHAPASALSGTSGAVVYPASVTPGQLPAGPVNDWMPDIVNVTRVRVSGTPTSELTGLVGGSDGRYLILTNVGVETIILRNQSVGSQAENRFAMNGDALLVAGASIAFLYDEGLSRWSRVS